ncbi:MAG: cupin domain-containing protein [Hyphomicrobiaceae bacterium]
MKRTLISTAALAFLLMLPQPSATQDVPKGTVIATPDKITWKPSPRTPGVEVADLVGDAAKTGPYVQRVKIPPNFVVQAHSHPEDRTYTVISGTWYVGWGDKYDPAKLIALPPGSFYTEPANVPHFVATKGEAVVFQISGNGPTASRYVDPAHAPKK